MKTILKKLYSIVPFKRHFFSFVRTFWQPGENLYKHLHFKGKVKINLPSGKSFNVFAHNSQFENELFWNGISNCWEQASIPYWIKLCHKSTVVFDVGAQSGLFTMFTKAENPNTQVHAFEPSEYFNALLKKNVELNDYKDVACNKLGVSNSSGQELIKSVWKTTMEVPTITLDDYIEKNNIKTMDLLKVDVDFHEIMVAEGFAKYFPIFQPTVLIEVLSDEVAQGIEKHWNTQSLGYLVFSIHEKNGTIRQMKDMSTRGDNMNFLLCKSEMADYLGLEYTTLEKA